MLTPQQAIETRHSIRRFTDQPIGQDSAADLANLVQELNRASGLNMQLMLNEPQGLAGIIGRINLKNAVNYLAVVGKNDAGLDMRGGYFGEQVVIRATQLGLGSCWFAAGAKRRMVRINAGEKMLIAVALGYAATPGKPHNSKPLSALYSNEQNDPVPAWFLAGVRAAQLAPTARNQQKFRFTLLANGRVQARSLGGILADIDLGIVRYHFEVGAGAENFTWADAGFDGW